MVKVLRPGNTTKEIECNICNALLSYHLKDTTTAWETYLDYLYQVEYINCPECGSKVMVSPTEEEQSEMLKNWKNRGFF
jgi:DNA-directed RNA polymerase subunit RPC12/RpoP